MQFYIFGNTQYKSICNLGRFTLYFPLTGYLYRFIMEDVKIPLPKIPVKFLDQFRAFIRLDGKSYATENTYVHWVRQFILFNNKQHPGTLNHAHVEAYLSHLAIKLDASPNTQKTALNALSLIHI